MSSTTPATPVSNPLDSASRAFLVYAPYRTDPGFEERFAAARKEHLEHINEFFRSKAIKVGGVFLPPSSPSSPSTPSKPTPIGSTLIVQMDTESEVRKMLEEDSFYKLDIWDKEKLVVVPYLFVIT